jgi:hypothetical protein
MGAKRWASCTHLMKTCACFWTNRQPIQSVGQKAQPQFTLTSGAAAVPGLLLVVLGAPPSDPPPVRPSRAPRTSTMS